MMKIHCPRCAHDFVDTRDEMADGDQAICPRCGARHVFRCADPGGQGGDARRELRQINGTAAADDKMC